MINIYTPNPIPVKAIFFDGNNVSDVEAFIGNDSTIHENGEDGAVAFVAMSTPNGYVMVPKNNWIVKNCMGEISFHPDESFIQLYSFKEKSEDEVSPEESMSEKDFVCATDTDIEEE